MENQKKRSSLLMSRSGSKRRGIALMVIAAATLSGCGAATQGAAGGADELFTFGLIAPETGPTSATGISLMHGFELAVKVVNENGGVLGQDVEYAFVDDRGESATATQAAQRLIQQDDVDYLFGTIADDTAIAVSEVAESAEVPFSTAIIADVEQCGPHFWPFGGTPAQVLPSIIPEMIARYGPKVALVGNDYVYPRSYMETAKGILEPEGGEVVFEGYWPLGTADWQPVINNITAEQPDWILSAVVGGDVVSMLQQADQAGLLDTTAVTGVGTDQDSYLGLGGIIEGSILTGAYTDQDESDLNQEFVKAYREEYDFEGPIPEVAAAAYDGVMFIAAAANAAGSTDAAAISAEMETLSLEGLTGTGSFNPDNHIFAKDVSLLEVGPGGVYTPLEEYGTIIDERPRDCA
jgi:ABC-type branched-subunit amino acid transport system substrate-binding protein